VTRTVAALAILLWFFSFAGDGLKSWFTDDDLMHLDGATRMSWGQLAADNALFFHGERRPLTQAVYKAMWGVFRLDPFGYRVVCFALLVGNLALAWWVFRMLSGSDTAATLGVLVFSYHANFSDLYLSTGTLCDLLCFTLFFGAVGWYLRIRLRGRTPSWFESAGLCAMTVLALNAKETAAALPVMLATTEWWYGDRRHWRTTVFCAAPAALLAGARLLLPNEVIANAAFQPQFHWAVLAERWRHYTQLLLYQNEQWRTWEALVFLAGCIGVAVWLRRREAWWGVTLALVAPLPVLFIPPRSLYVMYLGVAGFCLLGGVLAEEIATRLRPQARGAMFGAMLILALWLGPLHTRAKGPASDWYRDMEAKLKAPCETLRWQWPKMARGTRVLFVDDPLPGPPNDDYSLTFYLTLISGDPTLQVVRDKTLREPVAESAWSEYAGVFRLSRSKLERLR
jgi:hypothetical protein